MSEFVLIDLLFQREAVCRYVLGWKPEEILAWMSHFGTVTKGLNNHLYWFRSNIDGNVTAFYFTSEDELAIFDSGWLSHW